MPKHRVHRYTSEVVLGKPYSEVHRAIDAPYAFLGRGHRKMFHTYKEAYIVGSLSSSDPWAGLAGLIHVWLDQECSKDKEFKRYLEFMAKQDILWKKHMAKMRRLQKKRNTRKKRKRR